MINTEPKQIEKILDFCKYFEKEIKDKLSSLLRFLVHFGEIYNDENSKLPYHINLIDELGANENAHSRILAQLLRYKENNRYPFLEKFLIDLCKFNISIENPEIKKVDSCGHIDIPIFDKQYVVIIENKVTNKAPDQNNEKGGQLARYIETINKKHGKGMGSIFVVYTPKYAREPSDECWKNKNGVSYKESFKSRFLSLSYKDVLYPWLRDDILPNINKKDRYLRSAIEQYIDHLEGIFSLRAIQKTMNMNLHEFIKENLGLNDLTPELAVKKLSEKQEEISNLLTQLEELQKELQKEADNQFLARCYTELKELNFDATQEIDGYLDYYPSVGIKLMNELTVWLANYDDEKMFCQLNINNKKRKLTKKLKQIFSDFFEEKEVDEDDDGYEVWALFEDRENAFLYLKKFAEELNRNVQ